MPSKHRNRALVAGGARDPNVIALIEGVRARSVDIIPLLIGPDESPALRWNLETGELLLDGQRIDVAAAFVRRDVFHNAGPDADYRALAWYTTLQGWLASSPQIRTLNRGYLGRFTNKLHALQMARAAGLAVPETIVTNDIEGLGASHDLEEMVAKPVTGGGYCKSLGELLAETELRGGVAATPAIVQQRLASPDLRIYRIGDRYAGFRIHAEGLDYRASSDVAIEPMQHLPRSIIEPLERLMDAMGLDWGAADFKHLPGSDGLAFLEVNSDPMFSRFDRAGDGIIIDAILERWAGV